MGECASVLGEPFQGSLTVSGGCLKSETVAGDQSQKVGVSFNLPLIVVTLITLI